MSAGWRASRAASLGGLLWTLIRTDFKTRYYGGVHGFTWALLKPLVVFVVLLSVFSFVFGSDRNYSLRLVIGLFLWDFFADSTRTGVASLLAKSYLLTRARLPPWIFVVSSTSNAAITLAVFSGILVAYLMASGRSITPLHLFLYGSYVGMLAVIVTGINLATSVLFVRYRDLNQVWDVITQAGFFLAPIIYPLDILPERVHKYLFLWPPTPIIQFSRDILVDGQTPTVRAHALLFAGTLLVLLFGLVIYASRSRRIAEDL